MSKNEEFKKIIDDFINDLLISYPEYEEKFKVINYDEYYNHCKKIFPVNFFNILYENDVYLMMKKIMNYYRILILN